MEAINTAERLHERLQMGFSAPDDELFYRAHRFREWAGKNPVEALRWLPKLRRTKNSPATAHLWNAVAEIVNGA